MPATTGDEMTAVEAQEAAGEAREAKLREAALLWAREEYDWSPGDELPRSALAWEKPLLEALDG